MRSPFSVNSLSIVSLLLCIAAFSAQAQTAKIFVGPSVRVTERVDRKTISLVPGTHPALVDRAKIGERLSPEQSIQGAILVLQPSPEQEAGLNALLGELQDKHSSEFHKWLTPDSFGASFGVSQPDIAQVSAWLGDSGLQVDSVSRSNRFLVFSGTVGAVESTFHTEMHRLTINGEAHISNTTDISIPSALMPVVKGVTQLNDFRPRSNLRRGKNIVLQGTPSNGLEATRPAFTSAGNTDYAVAPRDIAKIYNATPLTMSGVDGTGTTIAVIGDSDVNLSDAQTFRSMFGLPKNDPNVILAGPEPGINEDSEEANLDIEMAGSLATGATVDLITSGNTGTLFGIQAAALYAVDNNVGDIITISFGLCEPASGSVYVGFWNTLWEQAAAQGQTVFVSSGDSGADGGGNFDDGCAPSNGLNGVGYSVNGLGSSAYNVSVGGTMFFDPGPQQYWQSGPSVQPFNSALGYIPEAAWNEGSLTTTLLNNSSTATVSGLGIVSGGGGVSIYTARPAWQTGLGVPTDSDPAGIAAGSPIAGLHRLVPDVAMLASDAHDGILFCTEGICSVSASGALTGVDVVGGTSVSAPTMASAQALINSLNGGRQGNANYYYYSLARQDSANSVAACQATNGTIANPVVTLPASTCNFHDIVAGSNIIPGFYGDTVGFGFSAGVGFDETTGLGSVNIANIARNWSSVQFNASKTTFTLTPATGFYGSVQTISAQVATNSGTPTGGVSLLSNSVKVPPTAFLLNVGIASGTVTTLPAGTYSIYAHYNGDGTYGPSDSAPVTVNISKASTATAATVYDLGFSNPVPTTTLPYSAADRPYIVAIVSNTTNGLVPNGAVMFSVQKDGVLLAPVTSALGSNGSTYFLAGNTFNSSLPANYPALAPGSYAVTANYTGSNFADSSATVSFVVSKAVPILTLTAGTEDILTDRRALLNIGLTGINPLPIPTGTVIYTDSTTNTVLGAVLLTNGAAEFRTPTLTATGAHLITASYSGDSSYAASTANVTVLVGDAAKSTMTLMENNPPVFGGFNSLMATVSPVPSAYSPVYLYEAGVLVDNEQTDPTSGIAYLQLPPSITPGKHRFVAVFAGDQQYRTSRASLTVDVAKNPTSIRLLNDPPFSTYGAALSYTIDISAYRPQFNWPAPLTGEVQLYAGGVGGKLLGSAVPVLSNQSEDYVATINTVLLPVGTDTVVAVYRGNKDYTASQSTADSVVVEKANPFISADEASIVYGTGSTQLKAEVTYSGPEPPEGAVTFTVKDGPSVTGTCTRSSSPMLCTAIYPTADLAARPSSYYLFQVHEAASKNYFAADTVGALFVTQANQTISFSALPSAVTYGTDGPFALNAVASSGLDISYTVSGPAKIAGKTLKLTGVGTVTVTASQNGNGNFMAANPVTQVITVSPATPAVAWAQPAAITYGTPLAGAQLDATASVPGSFTYSPARGTLLHAGVQTLSVTFTPNESTNYNSVTTTVPLAVNKANPIITWANPAAITYGTPLGSKQLNASANTVGSFVFTPPAGTILPIGVSSLGMSFAPTDAMDYNSVSANVAITVNKANTR